MIPSTLNNLEPTVRYLKVFINYRLKFRVEHSIKEIRKNDHQSQTTKIRKLMYAEYQLLIWYTDNIKSLQAIKLLSVKNLTVHWISKKFRSCQIWNQRSTVMIYHYKIIEDLINQLMLTIHLSDKKLIVNQEEETFPYWIPQSLKIKRVLFISSITILMIKERPFH